MKKIITLCLILMLALSTVGCGKTFSFSFRKYEKREIELPFEINDVENAEIFRHYSSRDSVEKKIISNQDDIKKLYNLFEELEATNKEETKFDPSTTLSFRFNLKDGTKYELIYISYRPQIGEIGSPTAGFKYFTPEDIGTYWDFKFEKIEAVSASESELPVYTPTE